MVNPVQDLLDKKNIHYTVSGQDFVIKCLNPEHEDNNPSFRIDKTTGISHCFSCGFKTNIFKYFNITNNFTSIKVAKLKDKLAKLNRDFNGSSFPGDMIPVSRPFRGISIKTLKKFEAFISEDRIYFPIKDVRGKNIVYVGRHTLSDASPKYLNYPKGVSIPLYPAYLEEKHNSLILVEGIFDFLNVYDKGLKNVACTFGTETLEKNMALKLLPYRTQGVSKIYLMFDGDNAGRNAMKKLKPLIEELHFNVEIINLEDDSDPGELSQEYVDSIKEYISAE